MKKFLSLVFIAVIAIMLVACGSTNEQQPQKEEVPADLIGEWKQTNSNADDSWIEANITETEIAVNWVMDNGDTKSVYWVGSFVAPTDAGDYSWTSNNDHDKTDSSLLASTADTKDFSYSKGELSFEVSVAGTTTTVRMEKVG